MSLSAWEPFARAWTTNTEQSPTTAFRLGRLLYGGLLAMMAVEGLRNAEERAAYAEAKGVPMPDTSNKAAHGPLLFGVAGVALWKLPRLAALAVATFFVGVTPTMHDFWAVDDAEARQQAQISFLKNTALALLGVASRE